MVKVFRKNKFMVLLVIFLVVSAYSSAFVWKSIKEQQYADMMLNQYMVFQREKAELLNTSFLLAHSGEGKDIKLYLEKEIEHTIDEIESLPQGKPNYYRERAILPLVPYLAAREKPSQERSAYMKKKAEELGASRLQ